MADPQPAPPNDNLKKLAEIFKRPPEPISRETLETVRKNGGK